MGVVNGCLQVLGSRVCMGWSRSYSALQPGHSQWMGVVNGCRQVAGSLLCQGESALILVLQALQV